MAAPTLEDMLAAINKQLGTSTPSPTPRRVTPSVAAPRAALRPLQFPDRGDSGGGLPGAVLSTLAWLDKPRAAIMSTGKELTDLATGKGFSFSDWKDQVNRHYGFGEYQQEYLQGIENVALPEWVPGVGGKKMLRYVTALTGDIMTDPLMLAGGLNAWWRAAASGPKLVEKLAVFANSAARKGTKEATAAANAAAIIYKSKNNVSAGVRELRKTAAGRKVMEEFGLDVGLRWRELLSGPVLGGIGRKLLPNRTSRMQAKQIPRDERRRLASLLGKAEDADDLNDLLAKGIQNSWSDRKWDLLQTAGPDLATGRPLGPLAESVFARAGRLPIERAFLPKWVTTRAVLPGFVVNVMAAPGRLAGRLAPSAVGRAAAKIFKDPLSTIIDDTVRAAKPGDDDHAALVHLGAVGTRAARKASSKHGIFAADSTGDFRKWYRSATSREGGFKRVTANRVMGQFTDTPLETFEGALMEMVGQPPTPGLSLLEGVQKMAAGWARQGVVVPVDTPDDLWRLVQLRQGWREVDGKRAGRLLEIYGKDAPLVRQMVKTKAMSGDYTAGIPTVEGKRLMSTKGVDGEDLNPEIFSGSRTDEAMSFSEQARRETGTGDKPWVPERGTDTERFRGKVEGRFARERKIHGPYFDSDAAPDEILRRVGVPRHVGAEERVSRGLHPSEAALEPGIRPGAEKPPRLFDDPVMKNVARSQPPASSEGDAFRVLPAEPDQMLEAVTEAVVGPRLGIDFEPRTVADLAEIIRGGRVIKFGGVGDDGQRLIPEGVDLMEILREIAPDQYRRQLDNRMRALLQARLENVEGAEMLSTKWKRTGPLEELAEIANVSLAAIEREALDQLNAADHLAFQLQRGIEDYFPVQSVDGVESTVTLTQVAEAKGWTAPVNRFGWSERQQMDYIAHRLGIMDEKTSFYVQDLPLREDMYVRGIGQDVHLRIFERELAEGGIIFNAELFYDLEAAYEVFNQRMGGWAKFIESVGPLPKDMTIDEFIRRITGEGPPAGARPPKPGGGAWFDELGKPISLDKFVSSLPQGSKWRTLAAIYRDASKQSVVDKVERLTKELSKLEVDTPLVRQQMQEAADAVTGAVDDLHRIEAEIVTAQAAMLGTLQRAERGMMPEWVRATHMGATMSDLFTATLRETAPRVARHIPDLDGTLIREWDVTRWSDITHRARRVLDYLTTVREELESKVAKRGDVYAIGDELTSPAEAAVRAERSVALATQRSTVAAEMGVAMDSPIPAGQRTWRRLMAFISPRERRIVDVSGDVPQVTREGGAVQQVDSISAQGEILAGSKTITQIPPDEARISWGEDSIHVPSDPYVYNQGGFEFWMEPGGGRIEALRKGEGYYRPGWQRVGRPDNADELIATRHGPDAVKPGHMAGRRGDDISPAGRNLIKIANPHPAPHRISPTVPAPPPRAVREAAAKAPGDVEVPKKLEDAARLIIAAEMASTSMIQRRLNMGFAPAGRLMSLLEHMGIVQSPSGPITRKVLVSEIPENFDALARDALVAEDVARLTAQADFEDGVRSGALQDIREPRPMSPSGGTEARFMSYARTSIEDVGAGVVVLRRSFAETNPRDAWDDVYRAIVNPHVPLEEALADPTAGERALAKFYAAHFPNQYATGRPPGAAGPNRNYVWMGKDELFAVKVMERAATLRRIQLDAAAGVRMSADDESFLTKTMGYRSVEEALENIDDDVLVLAELGLNPFPKRRETGATMFQSSQGVETTQNPTARMVPGETADQVTALVTTAQERMQRIASRHGLDTAGGKGITAEGSEELVDKALADVLAMGKRRRQVQSVVKEVDAEAAARVAADPNVPPAIAEIPWSERDLSVLEKVFKGLHEVLENPVAGLEEDLIPLMIRLQEQKMATDETVQAAESLFHILSEAGPTGSYVKGAQKQWKAPTVLRKYEQIIDEVKRLEDFLGVRISGKGLRKTPTGGLPGATTKLSPARARNPFAPLVKSAPFLDEQLARAYAALPPESETTFTETLASVAASLSRVIKGSGKGLGESLLAKPELRAKWVALADANAQVVELVAEQAEKRLTLLDEAFGGMELGRTLGESPGKVAGLEAKLAEAGAKRAALPVNLQNRLQQTMNQVRGLAPHTARAEHAAAPRLFAEGAESVPGAQQALPFDGPLQGGGMLGANAPKQLLDDATPESVVRDMIRGNEQANIELAEIAYYVGMNEELLRLLPKKQAAEVRKRLMDDLAADPLMDDVQREAILEHGWLGNKAREEYMRTHGEEGPLHWMYGVGETAYTAFDPRKIPKEGLQNLLHEGTAHWGANLIASAPNDLVAKRWSGSVITVLMAAQKVTDREQVSKLWVGYDKVHNWLKAQLVATPGFVMRNVLGGSTNMWFVGIPPTEIIRAGRLLQQAYRAGEGDLTAGVRLMARRNPESKTWDRMERLVDAGAHAGGQAASAVDVGIAGRSRRDFFVGQRTMQKPGVRVVWSPLSPEFSPLAAVRHANTFAEEAMRLGTGLYAMKAWGDTVDDAMYTIHKLHFDYGKLSEYERKGMRRAFPFYTWTRNNLPLQLEFMAKHPAKYNRLFSLKREMERNTPEEGTVPHYFLEPFGVRLPFQIMGAQIYSVPDTPFQDLLRYDPSFGGIGSTIEQLVSQATPIAKVPIEYWAGKQVFAGIPFTERYQQVPAIMERVPGLMHALKEIGWAKRNQQGEWKMQDNRIYLIGNLMPYIGVLQRAIPGLPGREKRKQERYISALISTLAGLSMRMNTKYEQQSERVRREIERYLDQRDRGDIEWRTR